MKEYLETLARFPDYSYRNSVLIFSQFPEASLVLGKKKWDSLHNRNVVDDNPIKIFAPSFTYKMRKVYKRNPETHEILTDKDDIPLLETKRIKILDWIIVNVYDVDQTEGEPIKGLNQNMQGDVHNFENMKEALIKSCKCPINFKGLTGLKNGYCDGNEIVIKDSLSEKQMLSTLIHEISHSILHINTDNEVMIDQAEIEAQAIAYTVLSHYGVNTDDYSFFYIANWSEGKKLSDYENCLNNIQNATKKFIKEIDSNLQNVSRCQQVSTNQKEKVAMNDRY